MTLQKVALTDTIAKRGSVDSIRTCHNCHEQKNRFQVLLQLPQLPLLVLLPDFDQNFRRTFANSGSLETGGQRQPPQGLGELQVKLRRLQKQRRRPGRESGPTGPT